MAFKRSNDMMYGIEQLTQKLSPLTLKINHHPLYKSIHTVHHVRLFMEQHAFAVWDFMCLLKELHRRLVSTAAPWFPPKDALSANLISSILVEEEGDVTEDGTYASHFDIYLTAMKKVGADTTSIETMLNLLSQGVSVENALDQLPLNAATKNFVKSTFSFFTLETHELAAAFVYGREGVTAEMFTPLLSQLKAEIASNHEQQFSTLIYYFERHIELDGEEHFPKAIQMLANLVNGDESKLRQVEAAAIRALTARLHFLTGIQQSFVQEDEEIALAS
ncbi:MAG: DUF3050 domain-containing protein [Legionellales bacterium]|nr:DUF3050 domain-containing protein [Legionellales bacterium]